MILASCSPSSSTQKIKFSIEESETIDVFLEDGTKIKESLYQSYDHLNNDEEARFPLLHAAVIQPIELELSNTRVPTSIDAGINLNVIEDEEYHPRYIAFNIMNKSDDTYLVYNLPNVKVQKNVLGFRQTFTPANYKYSKLKNDQLNLNFTYLEQETFNEPSADVYVEIPGGESVELLIPAVLFYGETEDGEKIRAEDFPKKNYQFEFLVIISEEEMLDSIIVEINVNEGDISN